ncbi:MAG: S8 family serine peptidase [Thermoplasmata archaeon]
MTFHFETNYLIHQVVPVLIETYPGKVNEISDWIYNNFELTKYKPIASEYSPLFEFSTIKSFNLISSVVSGPDIDIINSDPDVMNIYLNRQKNILQAIFPVVPPSEVYNVPIGINIPHPLKGQTGTVSGKYMYFTSMEAIRHLVGADIANQSGYTGNGIKVAVVDTGATWFNEYTRGKIIKQTAIPPIFTDANGHGEWCTSAIVGRKCQDHTFTNINKSPVINQGIAPDATLYSIKGLGYVIGTGSDSMLIRALEIALEDKVNVVSCSWGGSASGLNKPEDSPYYNVFNKLLSANIIPVVAAGNSGPKSNTIADPGDLPNVLTVGATNVVSNPSPFGEAGTVAEFSSRGPTNWATIKPDIVGPGAIIDSGITGVLSGAYTHWVHEAQALAGTSMATPIIAGLITLMDQAFYQNMNRYMTLNDIQDMFNTLPSSYYYNYEKNNQFGYGFLTWNWFTEYMKIKYGIII